MDYKFHRIPNELMQVDPTDDNSDAYLKAYRALPRAQRRKIDQAAKRALKKYRGTGKPAPIL
jgi:hypothetical protein